MAMFTTEGLDETARAAAELDLEGARAHYRETSSKLRDAQRAFAETRSPAASRALQWALTRHSRAVALVNAASRALKALQ